MVDAIAVGIRERGPEAVGMLLIGLVRIVLAVAVLVILLLLQLFGISTLGFSIESVSLLLLFRLFPSPSA